MSQQKIPPSSLSLKAIHPSRGEDWEEEEAQRGVGFFRWQHKSSVPLWKLPSWGVGCFDSNGTSPLPGTTEHRSVVHNQLGRVATQLGNTTLWLNTYMHLVVKPKPLLISNYRQVLAINMNPHI
jgi:hypothetical protein